MLTLHTKLEHAETIDDELLLPLDLREKSRLRSRLVSGEEVAVFTVRGTVLRDGDLLRGDDGRVVKIVAARETTYRVECDTQRALLRCAFHLGNRHTQVEFGGDTRAAFLRVRKDHVLKDMLEGMGATIVEEEAIFDPEPGAYGGSHHPHGEHHPLAPVPARQKIHRPSDKSS